MTTTIRTPYGMAPAADPPPIRTPYGMAPADDPPPPDDRRLMALCGEQALLEADLSQALAAIDALRRRVAALERRRRPARRGTR
jgi:hypothetical protein